LGGDNVKSLAILALILFLIATLAGPIAIALTWRSLVSWISTLSQNLALALTLIRRLLHGFLVTLGLLMGGWLTFVAVTPAKLFGLFSLVTSYSALRREYFPKIYIVRNLLSLFGISNLGIPSLARKKIPPVFSADGSEIIRAKKAGQLGRSSGRDGHGPGGQH
jgi:hypothetical protein